jgi:hypothetical protein
MASSHNEHKKGTAVKVKSLYKSIMKFASFLYSKNKNKRGLFALIYWVVVLDFFVFHTILE